MNSAGYVIFDGIDCIYTIDKDGIELFPTQEENIGKLNRHFDDQNFFFHFSDRIEKQCIAYIDRVENHIGQPLRLLPNYIIKLANTSPISSMRITGASIDEIFHPASYYYSKHETGKSNDVDLAYNTEIADHWDIRLDGETISVSLLYGGILDTGIASDLMLHPRLLLEFRPTTDYV